MANTVVATDLLPPGTKVTAYAKAGTGVDVLQRGPGDTVYPPTTTGVETATVAAAGTLTFTTLTSGREYLCFARVKDGVQTITIDATGVTWTASYGGVTTSALAFDISTADLKTALEGLATLGSGSVTSVTGGPGDSGGTTPYVVTFASTDRLPLTVNGASLTGGGHTATVDTTTGTARWIRVVAV